MPFNGVSGLSLSSMRGFSRGSILGAGGDYPLPLLKKRVKKSG